MNKKYFLALVTLVLGQFVAPFAGIAQAADQLKKLAANGCEFSLIENDRLNLHRQFRAEVDLMASRPREEVIGFLRAHLMAEGFERLMTIHSDTAQFKNMIDRNELNSLAGYLKFLQINGVSIAEIPVEVRIENGKTAYLLVNMKHSLLRSFDGAALYWVHDDAWARERFLDRPAGPTYLFGQFLGRSKFGTITHLSSQTTKEQALDLLGLRGYADFDKIGPLYLVSAQMTPELLGAADPKVACMYKWFNNKTDQWQAFDHFLENSIPGYTAGGLAEVVFNTFEITATSLDDLRTHGGEILTLR